MARSINSPGVQIVEKDLSQYQQVVGGTTVFVPGFAPQGPTDEVLLVTSISEFEQIYGTPQTPAERYFYYTSKQILNAPASLLTTRLPYGSGSGEGFSDQYSALLFPAASADNGDIEIGSPTYITLTEEEYEDILAKNFTWGAIPLTGSNPAPAYGGNFLDAGIIVVNKSKTAANELFEGYYLAITDNSEWGLNSDFTAVNNFYGLSSTTGLIPVPNGRFNFALSATNDLKGSESVSELIEKQYTYDVSQPFYNDSLVVSLFKVRRSVYEPQDLVIQPVESYIGSLQPNKFTVGSNAGEQTFFLETVVNKTSPNLQLMINPEISENLNWSNQTSQIDEPNYTVRTAENAKSLFPNSVYLPTFENTSKKEIGNGRAKIERALTLIESTESLPVDIIVDGGLSTIITNTTDASGTFVEGKFIVGENLSSNADLSIQRYRTLITLFNNFVQNTRQDCVFIADPLRQIFVRGENSKILDFKTNTFTQNIFQPLKNSFDTLNSNYSITYGNWVKGYDKFKDTNVWLPFSGYAAAAFARTDTFAQPWIAPAGLTRGIVNDVIDLAFNPNQKQRDFLYTISVNPVVFFSNDGYAIFGQKTLQKKPSAFDRINVRRLFLVLERATQTSLKYFVFEPNTEFTRTRLKNTITPILELAKNTEGIFDYLIVCDERNNTPDVVDRNELAVDIYIKPVKAAEFILVNFIATRTGQNFQELI
jgi:hypothetical protein